MGLGIAVDGHDGAGLEGGCVRAVPPSLGAEPDRVALQGLFELTVATSWQLSETGAASRFDQSSPSSAAPTCQLCQARLVFRTARIAAFDDASTPAIRRWTRLAGGRNGKERTDRGRVEDRVAEGPVAEARGQVRTGLLRFTTPSAA